MHEESHVSLTSSLPWDWPNSDCHREGQLPTNAVASQETCWAIAGRGDGGRELYGTSPTALEALSPDRRLISFNRSHGRIHSKGFLSHGHLDPEFAVRFELD